MRRTTISDTPAERRIYEEAAKDEEAFLVDHIQSLLDEMPPPPGWRRRYDKPGRPRKTSRRGPKQEFTWKPMATVLCLMALWECTRREARSHLANNPDLLRRIGLAKAPSPRTIGRALDRFNESWLKELNEKLVDSAQGGREDVRQTEFAGWTVLV